MIFRNDIIDLTSDDNDIINFNDKRKRDTSTEIRSIEIGSETDDNVEDSTLLKKRFNYVSQVKLGAPYSVKIDNHKNCLGIPTRCKCLVPFIFARCYHDNVEMISINSGKWMLFPEHEHVDDCWSKVIELLNGGILGVAAKVSVQSNEQDSGERHLICIYTYDFEDVVDVFRVLLAIRDNIDGCKYCMLNYKTDISTIEGKYHNDQAASMAGFESNTERKKGELVSTYQSPKIKEQEEKEEGIYMVRNNVGLYNKRYIVARRHCGEISYPITNNEYTTKSGKRK